MKYVKIYHRYIEKMNWVHKDKLYPQHFNSISSLVYINVRVKIVKKKN